MELMEVQEINPTMRLLGCLGQQQALILVDSGSAATFINTALVKKCGLSSTSALRSQYTTADGGLMIFDKLVPQLQWCCQGYTYCRDTKVMNLHVYDIILGADWLEEQGPMWIDWKIKVMKFTSAGREITMIGVRDNITQCPELVDKGLKGLLKKNIICHWVELHHGTESVLALQNTANIDVPVPVQELLLKFKDLFAKPQSLPPRRDIDHQIPLISGAQPVNVRPYRYSPHQKNEIKKQVQEILQIGIIQLSSSPFASSVLLVKKKDGSW
jgi:hypothetical protein